MDHQMLDRTSRRNDELAQEMALPKGHVVGLCGASGERFWAKRNPRTGRTAALDFLRDCQILVPLSVDTKQVCQISCGAKLSDPTLIADANSISVDNLER